MNLLMILIRLILVRLSVATVTNKNHINPFFTANDDIIPPRILINKIREYFDFERWKNPTSVHVSEARLLSSCKMVPCQASAKCPPQSLVTFWKSETYDNGYQQLTSNETAMRRKFDRKFFWDWLLGEMEIPKNQSKPVYVRCQVKSIFGTAIGFPWIFKFKYFKKVKRVPNDAIKITTDVTNNRSYYDKDVDLFKTYCDPYDHNVTGLDMYLQQYGKIDTKYLETLSKTWLNYKRGVKVQRYIGQHWLRTQRFRIFTGRNRPYRVLYILGFSEFLKKYKSFGVGCIDYNYEDRSPLYFFATAPTPAPLVSPRIAYISEPLTIQYRLTPMELVIKCYAYPANLTPNLTMELPNGDVRRHGDCKFRDYKFYDGVYRKYIYVYNMEQHNGTYTCSLEGNQEATRKTSVTFKSVPHFVKDKKGGEIYYLVKGDSVVLNCTVKKLNKKYSDKVIFSWIINGTLDPIKTGSTLELNSVDLTATGSYSCYAKNAVGVNQKTFTVSVWGPTTLYPVWIPNSLSDVNDAILRVNVTYDNIKNTLKHENLECWWYKESRETLNSRIEGDMVLASEDCSQYRKDKPPCISCAIDVTKLKIADKNAKSLKLDFELKTKIGTQPLAQNITMKETDGFLCIPSSSGCQDAATGISADTGFQGETLNQKEADEQAKMRPPRSAGEPSAMKKPNVEILRTMAALGIPILLLLLLS